MIQWKISALSIAAGAAATFGFVWLTRTRAKRMLLPAPAERFGVDLDEAARADALHDVGDHDALEDIEVEPDDVEPVRTGPFDEERFSLDEPYDAVDPEDIGTEYLRRATEAPPIHPEEQFKEDETVADASVELPVGSVDADGNTELHQPDRPSNASVELSPNEEELAQRAATEKDHESAGKRNG
jgi:hypothetical protein